MELDTVARSLAALAFVLGLIAAAGWLGRRFGLTPRATAKSTDGKRLAVVEVMSIDAKRRLVLVSRDGVEHLLLFGATAETVIETGIEPETKPAPREPAS